MPATVLLIGTMDTKGVEFGYVRDLLRGWGHEVLVLDAGVAGDPKIEADVTATEVAEAGGATLEELRRLGDRGRAMEVMTAGVRRIVPGMFARGAFAGIMGLGGSGGTTLATAAMRELPVGVPKLVVSTVASGDTRAYVGVKDVTMMFSVVDIAGLNPISRRILANAAAALSGMLGRELPPAEDRPLLAATMFGVTTPCVDRMRERFEAQGYQVLVFHATGSGGQAMEALIDAGFIAGVADMTTTEWCDEVVGGVLSAGPDRLSAAARAGLPQVVSCGALDMVNFGPFDTVPERFRGRTLYRHNPSVTLMRTTPEECVEIAERIAEKLNEAKGPTTLLLPLQGVSALDREGQPFHDPAASAALFETLRARVRAPVRVVELDLHINDAAFADTAAEYLLELLRQQESLTITTPVR
jgi:uncharacterized protein (UPF0261 family)